MLNLVELLSWSPDLLNLTACAAEEMAMSENVKKKADFGAECGYQPPVNAARKKRRREKEGALGVFCCADSSSCFLA